MPEYPSGYAASAAGKVNRAGALGAVKAPDGFWPQRIHIDSFAAVAPTRGDGNGDADVLAAEFLLAGSGLRHTRDAAVGDDALNLRAAGVTAVFPRSARRLFAMFMVCSSSDSRTPMRRPSITGRMPIFGKLIFFIADSSRYSDKCLVSCRLRTETSENEDDGKAQGRNQLRGGNIAGGVADKAHHRGDDPAANNGHDDKEEPYLVSCPRF